MGLDVTMHNSLGVAVVKRFEDLEHVVPDIVVREALIQLAEISVACVYEFSNDRGSFS